MYKNKKFDCNLWTTNDDGVKRYWVRIRATAPGSDRTDLAFLLTTSCSVVGAINRCYRYQIAFDMAITGNSDNDTPA